MSALGEDGRLGPWQPVSMDMERDKALFLASIMAEVRKEESNTSSRCGTACS